MKPPFDPSRPAPFPSQGPPPPPRPAPPPASLEFRIGGSWISIIGVIAIVFGVGFFLKLAFESGWITPLYRVVTGVVIGLTFLAGGEFLRKKYAGYAYALTGGGILILYLSIWASFRLYDELLSQRTAFIFMAVVTATAVLLAARYNALTIAVLGLFGGFLTPILLSTGVDNQSGLFTYIVLLDLGVLALAFRKQWRALNYLTFAATVLMSFAWYLEWYEPAKALTTVFFFTLLFAIFALVAVVYNVVNRRPTSWLDLTLVFLNALLYFGSSYGILTGAELAGRYQSYLGLFAIFMSGFYGALGFFTYRRDREDRLLLLTFLGLAFLFLVLAAPIQFDQQWVTMAWAIEGAVMTYVGLRARDKISLYAALAVFGIAAYHWFTVDAMEFAYREGGNFTPLLNARALSCAVLVAAMFTASILYKRFGDHLAEDERSMFGGAYLLGANVFAVTLLSMDVNSYFEQKRFLAGEPTLGSDDLRRLDNSYLFSLTALWSLYAAVAFFVGMTRKLVVVRGLALLLLGLAVLKVLFVDLWYYDAAWHRTVINQTFVSFAFVIGALAFGAWLYSRSASIGGSERAIVMPLLIAAAHVLALIIFSAEAIGHYDRLLHIVDYETYTFDTRYLEEKKQFVLSAVWTVYAMAAFSYGVVRNRRAFRLGAGGLLLLTVAKVLVFGISYLDAPWRTTIWNYTFASFALLVAGMALALWLYSRSGGIDEGEKAVAIPLLVGGANLLAVVALSAEAWGYYEKTIRAADATGSGAAGQRDLRLAQQMSLSVIWAVYGGVLLTVGILRRRLLLRLMGLLLLALTIIKVFFIDLAGLEQVYRIISFIVLGVILLAVGFLYQRFRRFIFDTNEER